MSEFFLKIINMSICASWIVLGVLVLRIFLKKAPKWVSVLLWGIVAVRLICPFSLESALSLIPAAETVSPQIMLDRTPQIDSGVPIINEVVNPIISGSFTPQPMNSANPLQILIPVAANIWLLGVLVLLVYTAFSYWRIRRKVATAVRWKDNIFQSENVASPFVLGMIKPRIYLPFSMPEQEMTHVIAHEKAHIQRKDHLWKPIGFLILTVYWFNPLLWLAYVLLCRDIELACDEKVVKEFDATQKADYSQALLSCSVHHRMISACPLAFGEVGVKNRVKSVLNYKKPAFWVIVLAIAVSIVVAVCFLTDPKTTVNDELSVFLDGQIADHFYSPEHTDDHFITISHKVLGVEESLNKTTVYMWVLYREYSCQNGQIKEETGSHIPTVITAKRTGKHGHYELVEYWEPRDGGYNVPDIKGKFPWYLHDKALDSQRYIKEQSAWCQEAAEEYFYSESQIGGADGPENMVIVPVFVKNMPTLNVLGPIGTVEAGRGTSSWTYKNEDGTDTAVMADSQHPLSLVETMPVVELLPNYFSHTNPNIVTLWFGSSAGELPPNKIEVLCWSEKYPTDDPESMEIVRENGKIALQLKDGNYIYEITAVWNSSSQYGGTVRYHFRTETLELSEVNYPEGTEFVDVTPADQIEEKLAGEAFVYSKPHYKAYDLWRAGGYTYKYRLEVTGRMHNAAKNTTYVILSNTEDITFDMAWKAAGYSSNSEDYFDPEDAMIVGSRLFA